MEAPRYYLTTSIYYVNDVYRTCLHYIGCDVLARFMRLDGVTFFYRTRRRWAKVKKKAAESLKMEPQAFTDKVSKNFRDLFIYEY